MIDKIDFKLFTLNPWRSNTLIQIFNYFRTSDEKSVIKLGFNRNYQCYSKCKTKEYAFTRCIHIDNTVKPLNSGHLRVLINLSFIERCPLLESNLIKIATFGTNVLSAIHGMLGIWDVRCWEFSLYIITRQLNYRL